MVGGYNYWNSWVPTPGATEKWHGEYTYEPPSSSPCWDNGYDAPDPATAARQTTSNTSWSCGGIVIDGEIPTEEGTTEERSAEASGAKCPPPPQGPPQPHRSGCG